MLQKGIGAFFTPGQAIEFWQKTLCFQQCTESLTIQYQLRHKLMNHQLHR